MARIELLLAALFLLMAQVACAQGQCGTAEMHGALMMNDPAYRIANGLHEDALRNVLGVREVLRAGGDTEVHTIPVVVHVIHVGEAVGEGVNISDQQIIGAIQGVNERFSSMMGLGPDIDIQFCLATRDPNGHPTNGINRVDGSEVPGYLTDGIQLPPYTCGANEMAIKDLSRWPLLDYYNIWVVYGICSWHGAYAHYPGAGVVDGTVIRAPLMNYGSDLLTHELGHGLFLFHTFDVTWGETCPVNDNCAVQGDAICDTPPHRTSDCGVLNPCSTTGIWDNSRYNYMSYCNPVSEIARFTEDQRTRMRATLGVSPRADLLSSQGCAPAFVPIQDPVKGPLLSVFPNPSSRQFTVQMGQSGKPTAMDLIDPLGRSMTSFNTTLDVLSLDVSHLAPGAYLLRWSADGHAGSIPVWIQR